ncbi:hypothetical protein [Meiothermus sp.]|jgi:hypothetical protein|uniref:hypothetical protein n=1 Tax=Meiothermus sp. TaxID=1955249 RepID=UPI0021DE1720|nr:hypothetical protein [Meiothermus sp.]GIW25221.1 MAG: hypothetical protein KatS3mg069_1488 [Meiothermus sp.]
MLLHKMPPKEAILIMDSRHTPTRAVRHQAFRSSWSKLYKAGNLYLDLSLKAEGKETVLVGQVIAEAQQPMVLNVVLKGPSQRNASTVNEYGNFRLSVEEQGEHVLEFDLGEETYLVRGLEVL